jgi:hypothetical protein
MPVPVPYADFNDPQTLNLYSYVHNLPTVKVDLDGHATPPQNKPVPKPPPVDANGKPAPPPTKLPNGKNGKPNSWVPKPSGKGRRVKWGPRFPVASPKGSQSQASWDPDGHWDLDRGDGTGRTRFTPDGTEVDHDGNPVNPYRDMPRVPLPRLPEGLPTPCGDECSVPGFGGGPAPVPYPWIPGSLPYFAPGGPAIVPGTAPVKIPGPAPVKIPELELFPV